MKLKYVRINDKDVICDENGNVLDDVSGYRYEQLTPDDVASLTVRVLMPETLWDPDLGVHEGGAPVDLEPRPL